MEFLPQPTLHDSKVRSISVERARARGIRLPTFSALREGLLTPETEQRMLGIDPDDADPGNLWRVHWFNSPERKGRVSVPGHVVLPKSLTGVSAPIVVLLGSSFPMIGAHKVLPAYAALVTLLVAGKFNPLQHRAVWPSTGNYCRGGVAISRIVGCSSVAVLPEGMSRERFEWLEYWVKDPTHILRTPGTESNVKEIYDACRNLAKDSDNVILNQFSAFSNYMVHRACTGAACEHVFNDFSRGRNDTRLAAFVSATGSAGTIAAGDYLKKKFGTRIAAVEALECPTMLENGYGEHNIQGIGDKHVPLIQNVMNMDYVIAVSDRVSDQLNILFNHETGRNWLVSNKGIDPEIVSAFAQIGLSGLANIVASIKLARHMNYGPDDVIVTVATDGAGMYVTERQFSEKRFFPEGFLERDAAHVQNVCLDGATTDGVLELGQRDKRRIFNLGYYTWVEQQGVSTVDFDARKNQSFWNEIAGALPAWDRLITEFNTEVGLDAA